MAAPAEVEVLGISKSYSSFSWTLGAKRPPRAALSGVSCSVEPGELTALIGPNGARRSRV